MAVALSLPAPCDVGGCERLSWEDGVCWPHGKDDFRSPGRVCELDGCERPHNAKGLCGTHYKARWMRLHRAAEGLAPNPDRRPRSVRQLRADLDRSAAIADARMWMDEVLSAALLNLGAEITDDWSEK